MTITDPVPFKEALQLGEVQTVLPTVLTSAMLEELEAKILERSFFSATVTKAEFLEEAWESVQSLVEGKKGLAEMRVQLKAVQQMLDMSLTSARLNLILQTNAAQLRGYGRHRQGQDPAILKAWPCQELYRAIWPKGQERNWIKRWKRAGGKLHGGRMIARKDDPIWRKISRFGTPYAPFDFNSGMRLRDISRREAIALGVIKESDPAPEPDIDDLNESLQASPMVRSQVIRQALEGSGAGTFNEDGVFLPIGGGP